MTKEYGIHLETMGSHETNPFLKRKRGMTEWASVEDGLPEGRNRWGSCWWIVKSKGRIPTTGLFINEKWYINSPSGGTEVANITHWMSLPDDPPEVVSETPQSWPHEWDDSFGRTPDKKMSREELYAPPEVDDGI